MNTIKSLHHLQGILDGIVLLNSKEFSIEDEKQFEYYVEIKKDRYKVHLNYVCEYMPPAHKSDENIPVWDKQALYFTSVDNIAKVVKDIECEIDRIYCAESPKVI